MELYWTQKFCDKVESRPQGVVMRRGQIKIVLLVVRCKNILELGIFWATFNQLSEQKQMHTWGGDVGLTDQSEHRDGPF